MSHTREDRIWRHYKALRKTTAIEGFDSNWKWLTLARHWRMPVRQIKDIIAARKGPTMEPVWCCEDHCFVESWQPKGTDLRDRLDGGEKTRAAVSEHVECERQRAYAQLAGASR